MEWKTVYAFVYTKEASSVNIPQELMDVSKAEVAVASWLGPVLQDNTKGMTWIPEAQKWA